MQYALEKEKSNNTLKGDLIKNSLYLLQWEFLTN